MKRHLLSGLFVLATIFTTYAQTPEWLRDDIIDVTGDSQSITSDASGNVYVATKYKANGFLHVAKLNTDGAILWSDSIETADVHIGGLEIVTRGTTDFLYVGFDSQTTTSGYQSSAVFVYNATTGSIVDGKVYDDSGSNQHVMSDFVAAPASDSTLILVAEDVIIKIDLDLTILSQWQGGVDPAFPFVSNDLMPYSGVSPDFFGTDPNTTTDMPFYTGSPLDNTPPPTDANYELPKDSSFTYGVTYSDAWGGPFPAMTSSTTPWVGATSILYRTAVETNEGLYVYYTMNFAGNEHQGLAKMNKADNSIIEWSKYWMQSYNTGSVVADENNNIYLFTWDGIYYIRSANFDVLGNKFDKDGNVQWSKIYGTGTDNGGGGNEVLWTSSTVAIDKTSQEIVFGAYCDSYNSGSPSPLLVATNYDGEIQNYTFMAYGGGQNVPLGAVLDGNGNAYVSYRDNNGGPAGVFKVNTKTNTLGPEITIQENDITCNGLTDGSLVATETGGNTPYTYAWSNGLTTSSITALASGGYTVTVTDNISLTNVFNASITEPSAISLTAAVTSNYNGEDISCNGASNGEATASALGGASGFSYLWSNGQTTVIATGLDAVTYSVTATDDDGCTATESVSLTEPDFFYVGTDHLVTITCNGAATGEFGVDPYGGSSVYSYLWSDGQTTQIATGLSAGAYSVTASETGGCTPYVHTITLTEPSAITVTLTVDSNATCSGFDDGGLSAFVAGGTSGYDYIWNNGATTASNTGIGAGTYNLTITDANNCMVTATEDVSQPSGIVLSSTVTDISCNGLTDGSAMVSSTGGPEITYTYAWANGQAGATVTGLGAGATFVTITSGVCSSSNFVSVTEPAALSVTVAGDPNGSYVGAELDCNGDNNGRLTATPAGGTAPYTYNWDDNFNGQSPTVGDLMAGEYNVTVTDNNNCEVVGTITVSEPNVLVNSQECQSTTGAGNTDGSSTTNASGGTSPYTYLWSNGATTASITGVGAGSYTITTTDANGCTAVDNCSVTDDPCASFALTSTVTDVICNAQASGGIELTPTSGPSNNYTYNWSTTESTQTITSLVAGTYSATISVAGCSDIVENFTITEPSAITATVSNVTNASCNGSSDASISVNIVGGSGTYLYDWSTSSSGTPFSDFITHTNTGLSAGTVYLDVNDADCMNFISNQTFVITLTEPDYIAGDADCNEIIDNGEIAGDIDGNGTIDNGETAGDTDGSGTIDNGETAGDNDGNGTIDNGETAGDTDGSGAIDNGETAGDTDGSGTIDNGETAGDTDGSGTIDNGETAGDNDGSGVIDNGETAGDTDGSGTIDNGETAGDNDGSGTIDNGETAGDNDGSGAIDNGETAGDTDGSGTIDNGETAGDTDGSGTIDNGETAGDTDGSGTIDNGEIAGDTDGSGTIDNGETAGDNDGSGTIDNGETAGDTDGSGVIDNGETAGDNDGSGTIDNGETAGDTDGSGTIDNGETAGDNDGSGTIDNGETAGDNDGSGVIDNGETAGDNDGSGIIDNGETAGDNDGSGVIDNGETAGDTDGSGTIDNGETAGDTDGSGAIDNGETAGDTDGNGTIDNGETAGDTDGSGTIDNGETAGDTDGSGTIDNGETAGDTDGSGVIDNGETAGDTDGSGTIDNGETAGDTDGSGTIDNGETAGDTDGSGVIDNGETAGDTDGSGTIDNGETAGDTDGSGVIDNGETAGDNDGSGTIDNGETAGDTDGSGTIDNGEIEGDLSGNGSIDSGEVQGDSDGNGVINNGEIGVACSDSITMNVFICEGESHMAGGANQTAAGTYIDNYTNMVGCDSVVTTNLVVRTNPTVGVANVATTLCDGDMITLNGTGATTYVWDNGATNGTALAPSIGTTMFNVTGTDANGCTDTSSITVMVNAAPTVTYTENIDNCVDSIIVSPTDATTYTWTTPTGTVSTSSNVFVVQQYNTSQDFTLKVTDGNACNSTIQITVVAGLDCTTIGIEEETANNNIAVYPNPTRGNVVLELMNFEMNDKASVTITNAVGQVVYQTNISNSIPNISLNEPSGVYFMNVQLNDKVITKRLTISK